MDINNYKEKLRIFSEKKIELQDTIKQKRIEISEHEKVLKNTKEALKTKMEEMGASRIKLENGAYVRLKTVTFKTKLKVDHIEKSILSLVSHAQETQGSGPKMNLDDSEETIKNILYNINILRNVNKNSVTIDNCKPRNNVFIKENNPEIQYLSNIFITKKNEVDRINNLHKSALKTKRDLVSSAATDICSFMCENDLCRQKIKVHTNEGLRYFCIYKKNNIKKKCISKINNKDINESLKKNYDEIKKVFKNTLNGGSDFQENVKHLSIKIYKFIEEYLEEKKSEESTIIFRRIKNS